jgi:hypothetical protein
VARGACRARDSQSKPDEPLLFAALPCEITMPNTNVESLLVRLLGRETAEFLFSTLNFPTILQGWVDGPITRAELAQAIEHGAI